MRKVADVGVKEDVPDQEEDLLSGSVKRALGVNVYHHRSFKRSRKVEGADIFPKSIVPNGCVMKGGLDFTQRGDLGDYRKIR